MSGGIANSAIVVAAALEEWPIFMDQLCDAIDRRDLVTIHRVAHTFKNAFRTLGAAEAYGFADRLEKSASSDVSTSFHLSELWRCRLRSAQLTAFVASRSRCESARTAMGIIA